MAKPEVNRNPLEKNGWQCSVGARNQKGFDVTAQKNDFSLKIEVKSRTIRGYSPGGSLAQRTSDRRRFRFSDSQMRAADAFICVFIGPDITQAYVVPKNKFDRVRQRTKKGNWLSFDPNREFIIRDHQKIGVSEYVEGWQLLDT